jgi:hypothetical protein
MARAPTRGRSARRARAGIPSAVGSGRAARGAGDGRRHRRVTATRTLPTWHLRTLSDPDGLTTASPGSRDRHRRPSPSPDAHRQSPPGRRPSPRASPRPLLSNVTSSRAGSAAFAATGRTRTVIGATTAAQFGLGVHLPHAGAAAPPDQPGPAVLGRCQRRSTGRRRVGRPARHRWRQAIDAYGCQAVWWVAAGRAGSSRWRRPFVGAQAWTNQSSANLRRRYARPGLMPPSRDRKACGGRRAELCWHDPGRGRHRPRRGLSVRRCS